MWQFFYRSISAHLATQLNWEINIMKCVHVQFTLYSDTIMVFTVVLCAPILIYICWFSFLIFISAVFFCRSLLAFQPELWCIQVLFFERFGGIIFIMFLLQLKVSLHSIRVAGAMLLFSKHIYVSSYVNGPFPSCRIAFVIFFISLIAYLILYCRNICCYRMLFSECFFSLLIRYCVCVFWLSPATYYKMLFARSNHCGSNIIRRIIVNQNHYCHTAHAYIRELRI